jgi:type VI secretion system ImpC/EvpB family protein
MDPRSAQAVSSGTLTQELFAEPVPVVPAAAPRIPAPRSLLDVVLDATPVDRERAGARLDQFLKEPAPGRALELWLGAIPDLARAELRRHITLRLTRDIAHIDDLLNRQVNAILHHPDFQKLEASWRGLHYLVEQVPETENIKVRVLNVSWKALNRDLVERAIDFDQSQLFRKVYSDEFGTPGGEPFGMLLGDYEIRPRPSAESPVDDLATLGAVSSVAAAAFAPFISAAHPSLFGLDSFTEMELPLNLSRTFDQIEYVKWNGLRDREDARFVGLTLPRVLTRLPYEDDNARTDRFCFREDVEKPDRSQYLWGTPVYAFGAVVVRAFAESGWLAAIRGVERGVVGNGLVTNLPCDSFATSKTGVALKSITDGVITDAQEKELGDLGFIPLCQCQDTGQAAFYGNQSVQRPKKYDELAPTVNARLSAMLQYILCVSRFAHYIKVITRDRIGSFEGPSDCEDKLRKWLQNYVTTNDSAGSETRAKHPLREAKVKIMEIPEKPGSYRCEIHLRPHFQLDQMTSAVRLVTELAPPQRG